MRKIHDGVDAGGLDRARRHETDAFLIHEVELDRVVRARSQDQEMLRLQTAAVERAPRRAGARQGRFVVGVEQVRMGVEQHQPEPFVELASEPAHQRYAD